MKPRFAFFIPVLILLFIGLAGLVVQQLWNYVTPAISDQLRPLDYWHALGLLVLCRLLFGGFGGKGGPKGRAPWARKQRLMREGWRNLTPEDRTRLRDEWKRCSPWGGRFGGKDTPPQS